jgi:pantothenate kinase
MSTDSYSTKPFVVPENDEVTAANMSQVEANSKATNFIIQGLGKSDFDHVVHLKSAYQVWKALCDYHEGSSTIKEVRQDMYKKDYMRFGMKPSESLDDFFARFNKILSNLRAVNVTYTDAENAHKLLGALDMSIWEMKVTSIRESTVMSTLTLDVLYSKLKTHELDVLATKN